jgi:nitric oxide dioxygenase
MLTASQIELIKASVPVLREGGVALTTHFYQRMLSGNPELRNIFNQAHQAQGQQQRALAAAVLAYAENIENPAVLMGAVSHIAHKHATINIRPEEYAIVGRHLLASIQEVLGEAATPELIDAWAAAYGQLAKILIGEEAGLYQKNVAAEGGWSGWRPFVIVRKTEETDNVTSFYLRPADGGALPKVRAGEYVSLRLFVESKGYWQPRQYTVTGAEGNELRISVKRVDAKDAAPAGVVSSALHALEVGARVELSSPSGEFTVKEGDTPLLFLAAGIGITPILAMVKDVAAKTPNRPVTFLYSTQDKDHFPLKSEMQAALGKLTARKCGVFLTQAAGGCGCACSNHGRITAEALKKYSPDTAADAYVCGPVGFMDAMTEILIGLGFKPEQIHTEVFGTGSMQ